MNYNQWSLSPSLLFISSLPPALPPLFHLSPSSCKLNTYYVPIIDAEDTGLDKTDKIYGLYFLMGKTNGK